MHHPSKKPTRNITPTNSSFVNMAVLQRKRAFHSLSLLAVLTYLCQQHVLAFLDANARTIHSSHTSLRRNEMATKNNPNVFPLRKIVPLAMDNESKDTKNQKNPSKAARERGVYTRPSAAIEKGSGFFIPGLEGSRIRFIFGITVLVVDAANHILVGGRPGDFGQSVAECSAAFYGAFLLLQGSIELAAERGYALRGSDASQLTNESNVSEQDTKSLGFDFEMIELVSQDIEADLTAKSSIAKISKTIINITPATYIRFVDEEMGDLYSIGTKEIDVIDESEKIHLIKSSLDAVSESRGGRVALTVDHPSSKLVPPSARRCILIQKVDSWKGSRACIIISSNRLLPSFTKSDLRWIGQLAEYNKLSTKQ
ncbi:hypothetical protein ACHAXS_007439 [Conticribra weissflogii]